MRKDMRIIVYKWRGNWCAGDKNDFSKPLIDESLYGALYITLHNRLDSCKAVHYKRTHKKSNLTVFDMFMLYPKDGICPVLGIPLQLTLYSKRRDETPSVDKLIPARGYIYGNVRIISWLANKVRGDKTTAAFFRDKAKKQYDIYQNLSVYLESEIRPTYEI